MTLALIDNGLPWAALFSAVVLATLAGDYYLIRMAIRRRSLPLWISAVAGVIVLVAVALGAGLLDLIVISCPPTNCFD